MFIPQVYKRISHWLKQGIQRKLVFWSIGFWIVSVSILSLTFLWTGQNEIMGDIKKRNVQIASIVSRDINSQISSILSDIRIFSHYLEFLGPEMENQTSALLTLRLSSPQRYRAAYYFDVNNKLLIHLADPLDDLLNMDDFSDIVSRASVPVDSEVLAAFREANETGTFISDVQFIGLDRVPVVNVAVPLSFSSIVSRVIVLQVDVQDIWQRINLSTVGETGYTYAVSQKRVIIAHPNLAYLGRDLPSELELVLDGYEGFTEYNEHFTQRAVYAAYSPVGSPMGWGIVVEQDKSEANAPIVRTSIIIIIVWLVLAIIGTLGILIMMRSFTRPIVELTWGAQRIAGGDFDHTIDAETGDEIQSLARQFNTMAGALKESYSDLEQKVEERTRGERRRAEQLRSINEVGRRISSILSLDELLPYVVSSLQEAFNYYNVNIFLIDSGSDGPVLKASASELKVEVPIGFHIKLAEGIVGWVAHNGEPLIAGDVSKESKYLLIQELADTRSELAVPIQIGIEILGVLDIQSTELNAFDEVDLFTAQTLADQVAIAIENARLYQETREMAVIEERNRMAREIHDTLAQGFAGIVLQLEAAEQSLGENVDNAHEHLDHARRLARESLNEARRSVRALRPQALEQLPLIETLKQEMEKFTQDSGIKANFSTSGKRQALHADMENAILRICQESLANAKKHAQAEQVTVILVFEREKVGLSIRDNGIGFDTEVRADDSFGLIGMTERARLLGGTLVVQSEKGKGTLIEVMIPIA
jgi:signal transduction histidine kinase/HAMP domain-containing protein